MKLPKVGASTVVVIGAIVASRLVLEASPALSRVYRFGYLQTRLRTSQPADGSGSAGHELVKSPVAGGREAGEADDKPGLDVN